MKQTENRAAEIAVALTLYFCAGVLAVQLIVRPLVEMFL